MDRSKYTPDVICIIADCVLDFVNQNDYKGSLVQIFETFKLARDKCKRDTTNRVLHQIKSNRYDKFCSTVGNVCECRHFKKKNRKRDQITIQLITVEDF